VPTLQRPVGRDVVQQLMTALAAARPHASSECRAAAALGRGCRVDWRATAAVNGRLRYCIRPLRGSLLLPLPPSLLQVTLWGWQRRWRGTCKLRSVRGTACVICCSHAG
jgi:hypothetical protein